MRDNGKRDMHWGCAVVLQHRNRELRCGNRQRTKELTKTPDHVGEPNAALGISICAELIANGPDVIYFLHRFAVPVSMDRVEICNWICILNHAFL